MRAVKRPEGRARALVSAPAFDQTPFSRVFLPLNPPIKPFITIRFSSGKNTLDWHKHKSAASTAQSHRANGMDAYERNLVATQILTTKPSLENPLDH
jgi:hypothetical protein